MDDDERVVRDSWDGAILHDNRLCTDGETEYFVSLGHGTHDTILYPSEAEAWHAARLFTEARQEEVREIDEEIATIRTIVDSYVSHGGATFKRTLQRLRDIRAGLVTGMKEAK